MIEVDGDEPAQLITMQPVSQLPASYSASIPMPAFWCPNPSSKTPVPVPQYQDPGAESYAGILCQNPMLESYARILCQNPIARVQSHA